LKASCVPLMGICAIAGKVINNIHVKNTTVKKLINILTIHHSPVETFTSFGVSL